MRFATILRPKDLDALKRSERNFVLQSLQNDLAQMLAEKLGEPFSASFQDGYFTALTDLSAHLEAIAMAGWEDLGDDEPFGA